MANWRIEIEDRHTVTREKVVETDSEDAARAIAEAEGEENWRTWDELYTYADLEISSVLEIDERGCPCCGSSDLRFDRSCAGCGQPWPRTPAEWQVAHEAWLAAHRAEHPDCTCCDRVAAQVNQASDHGACGVSQQGFSTRSEG